MGYQSIKGVGIAGLVLLALSCSAQAEDNPYGPLDTLLTSKTDSACFRRDYDAAHLRRHLRQMTKAIMLSFRRDGVRIQLEQKDRKAPRYIVASCDWSVEVNRGVRNHPIPLKKDARYDCIVVTSPGSAREGGYAIIDPASDGQSLMLYIDDPVVVQDGLGKDDPAPSFRLGREDRKFQLTRINAALCKPMDDALAAIGL